MKLRQIAILGGVLAGSLAGAGQWAVPPLRAAEQVKPTISAEASAAVQRMGQTLRAQQFSFRAQTIRVSSNTDGQLLHIFHTLTVTVRRPDRLLVERTGDDGDGKFAYDGKTLIVYLADRNKYARIAVPATITGMMEMAMGRLGVDFPLADLLTETPDKSFLSGVTAGAQVNRVTIDGVPCRHLAFFQPPGIELELWVEDNDRSLPRRLIVTYQTLPGQPNFIATFSDWNFSIQPTDAEFAFQPPAGATQVQVQPRAAAAKAGGGSP